MSKYGNEMEFLQMPGKQVYFPSLLCKTECHMSDEGRGFYMLISWYEKVINLIQYFNQNFKLIIIHFFFKNSSNLKLSNAY